MENSMDAPHKFKNITTTWSSKFQLQGIYQEVKIGHWRNICPPVFIEALFIVVGIRKQPKCPSTDELRKKWHIHAVERYSAMRK